MTTTVGRPRARLGLVAAVLAGAAGLGLAACGPAPGPGGPGTTTTTFSVPESPATTLPGTPSRPAPLVAADEDGSVVVLSADGAVVRTLVPAQAGATTTGVTVSPDGATAWVARSVPAPGIWRVPTDGSAAATQVATGTSPEAGPDGASLAYADGHEVVIRTLAGGAERRWAAGGPVTGLSWAGDGRQVLAVRGGTQLVRVDPAAPGGGAVTPVAGVAAGAGETLFVPLGLSGGLGTVLVGTGTTDPVPDRFVVLADGSVTRGADPTTGGARDRATDRSFQWGLRTDSYGNVRWSVGGGTGLVARGYTAADW
jgi:hypothetical protein